MLDALFSAPDGGAQCFPLKLTACADCGASFGSISGRKKRCADCAHSHKLELKAAERRRYGIPQVKGATFKCEECGSDYCKTSKSAGKYCLDCRDIVAKKKKKERYLKRYPERRPVGSEINCSNCDVSFIVRSSSGIYCEDCKKLSKSQSLPHLRKAINERRLERKKIDPRVALDGLMRDGIRMALRGNKGGENWCSLVGYTAQELKIHLERQFLPGMTWENRGKGGWVVDHIIPRAAFSYDSATDEEFKACWSMTNLRPLWEADNLKKGAERTTLL